MNKKFTLLASALLLSAVGMSAQLKSVYPEPGYQYNPQYGDITLEFSEGLTNVTPVYSNDPEMPDLISYYLYDSNVYLTYTDTQGTAQSIEIPHRFELGGGEGSSWVNIIEVQDRGTGIPKFLNVKIADESFPLPYSHKSPFATAMDDADMRKGFSIVFDKVEVADKPCTSTTITSTAINIADDGTITIDYEFPKFTYFIDATWPEVFMQSWPEGDTRGIATLNFDGPVGDFIPVSIYFGEGIGESETQEIPVYTLSKDKVSIKDNSMIIDFTGISYKNYAYTGNKVVTIFVEGLQTPDGVPVYFNGSSSTLTHQIEYINEPANESGVASLATDGKFNVYSIKGENILNTTDANDLNNLPNGIYIINGKKIVIK